MVVIVEKPDAIWADERASGTVNDINNLLFKCSSLIVLLTEPRRKNNESACTLLSRKRPDNSGAVTGSNGNYSQVCAWKESHVGIRFESLNNRRFRINNKNFSAKATAQQIL